MLCSKVNILLHIIHDVCGVWEVRGGGGGIMKLANNPK